MQRGKDGHLTLNFNNSKGGNDFFSNTGGASSSAGMAKQTSIGAGGTRRATADAGRCVDGGVDCVLGSWVRSFMSHMQVFPAVLVQPSHFLLFPASAMHSQL